LRASSLTCSARVIRRPEPCRPVPVPRLVRRRPRALVACCSVGARLACVHAPSPLRLRVPSMSAAAPPRSAPREAAEILADLNDEQKAAVTHGEGPLL